MAQKINFTDAIVGDLEVREKKYDVWDAGMPGLCLRIPTSGKKVFYFVYSIHRRPRWFKIGPVKMTTKAARLRARELIGDVARDRDPQAERRVNRGGITFAQLQKRYVDEYAKRHNKSWMQANTLMKKNVLPRWGDLKAAEITQEKVNQLIGQITSADRPTLANQVKFAISAVFTFAIKKHVVAVNPCKGIDDNPTNDRERVLSKSEVPLFWKACDAVHQVKAAALKVILLTGQRPGEVSRMRREHIRDGWWEMPKAPVPELGWKGTKNKKSHRVFLSDKVLELIGEGTTGFVFAGEKGNAISDLDQAMKEISRLCAFVPAVRPHDLRRSAGTVITSRGHGRQSMDRILNHHKKSTGDIYDRYSYTVDDEFVMKDLADAIMQLVEGRQEDNVVEFGRAR